MPVIISNKMTSFFKTNNTIENIYCDFSGKIPDDVVGKKVFC
jgi:hypothetical protein